MFLIIVILHLEIEIDIAVRRQFLLTIVAYNLMC